MIAQNLTQSQLMKIAPAGLSGMAGPTWRRIDCAIPGIGIETWGCLVEFGGRYLLEDLAPWLSAPNPPMFKSEYEAVTWLVDLINTTPAVHAIAREGLEAREAEAAAKTTALRDEELANAKAIVEAAAKRARDSESS